MFREPKFKTSKFQGIQLYEGKSIENELEEIITQKKPIEATAPLVYTEKRDGVIEDFDIRTDKWEAMQRAANYVNEQKREYRKADIEGKLNDDGSIKSDDGKAEPTAVA